MAILNYTTSIDSEKTIAEIQKCLAKHGANKITTDYDANRIPCAVTCCITLNENLIAFALPANSDGVLKAMRKSKVPNSKCTPEQAQRVAWRIIKDWVEAQMAIVEAQLAEVTEVFLPYAITKNGQTVYKEIKESGMVALNSSNN